MDEEQLAALRKRIETRDDSTQDGLDLLAEINRLRIIERRARAASDFLYEHGWQTITQPNALNNEMFNLLFLLRDALSDKPTFPEEVE